MIENIVKNMSLNVFLSRLFDGKVRLFLKGTFRRRGCGSLFLKMNSLRAEWGRK